MSESGSLPTVKSDASMNGCGSPGLPTEQYRPLIERIRSNIEADKRWFSCEFFPPRTEEGAMNLISKLDTFGKGNPLFCDITWHAAGKPTSDLPTSSMTIASTMLNYCGLDTMLHMTCVGQTEESVVAALEKAKTLGIRNILALRGDRPAGSEDSVQEPSAFNYAVDLVRFIRCRYGNFFNICVAGYPTGHPEAPSYEEDLRRLKEKIEAGSDFVITQLFFEANTFLKFVSDCRKIGITCPILPGVLPIQAYESLKRIVKISKLKLPAGMLETMETIKDNDEAIRNFGIYQCTQMCKDLFESGQVHGIHFYTLNREVATLAILKNLCLWREDLPRPLPWKPTANHERKGEQIRPVFWSNRPTSYVHRTKHWEEFPNGRWGRPDAPAFGELNDYYLFYLTVRATKKQRLRMWGSELTDVEDVWRVFANFVSGQANAAGERVTQLPWCADELQAETDSIRQQLVSINSRGVLTINSQPSANGVPSDNPTLGWGGSGGYVYQKAYLEFFISCRCFEPLQRVLSRHSHRVSYQITNKDGSVNLLNFDPQRTIALTWGVFPASEVIQPTVCDNSAFMAWKDEAFALWMEEWGRLYEPESVSRRVIENIADSHLLVTLVDNEFTQCSCLWSLVDEVLDECDCGSGLPTGGDAAN